MCAFTQTQALETPKLTGTACLAFRRRLRIFLSRLIQFITTEPLASSAASVTVPPSAMTSGTEHAYVSILSTSMLKKQKKKQNAMLRCTRNAEYC